MRAPPGRQTRSELPRPLSESRAAIKASQRRRILLAAGELIAKRGYGQVTVELIVKRAHVGFRTFYGLYRGKEDCFLDLFDASYELAETRIRAALAASPGSWPERVALALRVYVELIVASPLIARACIVEGPTAGPVILERYTRASRALIPLLLEGRAYAPAAAGLPRTLEPTLAGSALWSAYQRLIVGESERLELLLPELLETVLRPYLGEEEAAAFAEQAWAEEA
jgi:AcrR family transcriptional regulator